MTIVGVVVDSGTTLTCYKDEAAFSSESPLEKYNLQGTEVTPDVDAAKNKYAINIGFPSSSADDAIRLTLEDVGLVYVYTHFCHFGFP